jgi:hypothetical protein
VQVFPGLELRVSPEDQWNRVEAQGKKKRRRTLSTSIALSDDTINMFQAVPLAAAV